MAIRRGKDWPENFRPNLSPAQCIKYGIFGGTYFNNKSLINIEEFPKSWFNVGSKKYESKSLDKIINYYNVLAGTSQKEWEKNNFMHEDDPRGWFQWYCRYYLGRRHEDDERQIKRWSALAHPTSGRFASQLYRKINLAGGAKFVLDPSISPVIRQTLLHWAYMPNEEDLKEWKNKHNLS